MFRKPANGDRDALRRLSTGLTIVALSSVGGSAQSREWTNPISGLWDDALNWMPMDVPDTRSEIANISAPGNYVVTLNRSIDIAQLRVENVGTRIELAAGSHLDIALSGSVMPMRGALLINPTGENLPTSLTTSNELILDGAGELTLNAHPDNPESAVIGTAGDWYGWISLGAMGISGNGVIHKTTGTTGPVRCDQAGRMLDFRQTLSVGGADVLASNGGTLQFKSLNLYDEARLIALGSDSRCIVAGGSLYLYDAGDVVARGEGATISLIRTNVNDGEIRSELGGTCRHENVAFFRVRLSGVHELTGYANIFDKLTINATASLEPTTAHGAPGFRTFSSGAIVLNAHPASLSTARLTGEFWTDRHQALIGNGTCDTELLRIDGRIAPGTTVAPAGQIDLSGGVVQFQPTSVIEMQIGGYGVEERDRLTGHAAITVNGTLSISAINGFEPQYGEDFVLISGESISGGFTTIVGAPVDAPYVWGIRTNGDEVAVFASCLGDLDGDTQIGLQDLARLLANWNRTNANVSDGDLNRDRRVNNSDLQLMLAMYGTECGPRE